MDCLRVILLFALSTLVLSEDSLLTPCEVNDTECLSRTTQEFLQKTSNGIPEYNIKQIDPLYITSLDYVPVENPRITMHLHNITVKGLKNQKLSEMKMNTSTKSVTLQTKLDVDVSSELEIELENGKKFSGEYGITGLALSTAQYDYNFQKDAQGVEHFEVGPETITCEAIDEPKINLPSQFAKEMSKDEDIKYIQEKYRSNETELRQKMLCAIVKTAYVSIIHNIRAAAQVLPKNAFLKGI